MTCAHPGPPLATSLLGATTYVIVTELNKKVKLVTKKCKIFDTFKGEKEEDRP